jgi:hypothetical protein
MRREVEGIAAITQTQSFYGGNMPQFELKMPKTDLDRWADEYWKETNRSDEKGAFDAGSRILQGGLSENDLKDNLKKIIYWKSPRVVHYIDGNPPEKIREAIEKATAPDATLQEAIVALTGLRGVGLPVASAILTAIFPHRYTVIDFRALEALGHDAAGIEFYRQYLEFCRELAESGTVHPQADCPAPTTLRALDRALWQWSASKGVLKSE